MECLPNDYSCYTFSDINEILSEYKQEDLENASLNNNEKAQSAIIIKIEVGLLEYAYKTKIERIDALFQFWKSIGKKQSRKICGAIIETVMGDVFYRSANTVDKDSIEHARKVIKNILPNDEIYNDKLNEYSELYSN